MAWFRCPPASPTLRSSGFPWPAIPVHLAFRTFDWPNPPPSLRDLQCAANWELVKKFHLSRTPFRTTFTRPFFFFFFYIPSRFAHRQFSSFDLSSTATPVLYSHDHPGQQSLRGEEAAFAIFARAPGTGQSSKQDPDHPNTLKSQLQQCFPPESCARLPSTPSARLLSSLSGSGRFLVSFGPHLRNVALANADRIRFRQLLLTTLPSRIPHRPPTLSHRPSLSPPTPPSARTVTTPSSLVPSARPSPPVTSVLAVLLAPL